MIVLVALVLGVGLGSLSGGRFRNLEHVRLRGEVWLMGCFAAAVLLPRLLERALPEGLGLAARIVWASSMLAVAVLGFVNWRTPGMLLLTLGLAANLVVIMANAGMPVSAEAVRAAAGASQAVPAVADSAFHTPMHGGTTLPLLGDVIPVPGPRSVRSAISLGDVLQLVGIAVLLAWGTVAARPEATAERSAGLPHDNLARRRDLHDSA